MHLFRIASGFAPIRHALTYILNKQIGCVSSAVLIFAKLIMRERQCSKWTDGIAGSLNVVFNDMVHYFVACIHFSWIVLM